MTHIKTPISVNQGFVDVQPDDEIWIRGGDKVSTLAEKICRALIFEEREHVDMASIGAQALNQGVKAIAEARARIQDKGLDLHVMPYFSVILDGADRERTRIMLRVFVVEIPMPPEPYHDGDNRTVRL